MPTHTIASKFGFAALIEPESGGIPEGFAGPIRNNREHLGSLLAPLRGRVEGYKARTDLSESGKFDLIKADVVRVLIDADHADRATTVALKNLTGGAQSALSSRLYPSRNSDAPLLHAIQATAATFAARSLSETKFGIDGDGKVQLSSGNDFHKFLSKALDTLPLSESGAVVLALSRLDPLAKAAIGGDAVVEASRGILERRAESDPECKAIIDLRAFGQAAERIHASDRSTVTAYVALASGLPRETIHALAPKAAPRA